VKERREWEQKGGVSLILAELYVHLRHEEALSTSDKYFSHSGDF